MAEVNLVTGGGSQDPDQEKKAAKSSPDIVYTNPTSESSLRADEKIKQPWMAHLSRPSFLHMPSANETPVAPPLESARHPEVMLPKSPAEKATVAPSKSRWRFSLPSLDHPTKKKKAMKGDAGISPTWESDPRSLGDLTGGGMPHEGGFEMNLMPSVVRPENDPRHRLIQLLWVAGVTMFGLTVIYVGLLVYESRLTNEGDALTQELQTVGQELAKKKEIEERAKFLQGTLKDAEFLLHHHIYWTHVFAVLEDLTLPDVSYLSLTGDTTGTLSRRAQATDFATAADQVRVFQEAIDRIASISVTSGSVEEGSVAETLEESTEEVVESSVSIPNVVQFDLSLTVTADVLLKSLDEL